MMHSENEPVSVEITLKSGEVIHMLSAEGDMIRMDKVVTQTAGTPASNKDLITYYTLVLVPRAELHKDAI